MLQFVFIYAAILSIGVLLVLIVRSWPRMRDTDDSVRDHGVIERFILSDIPQKFDAISLRFAEKFVRKLKVSILKLDNYLTERLKQISSKTKEAEKIDFGDISEATELLPPPEEKTR